CNYRRKRMAIKKNQQTEMGEVSLNEDGEMVYAVQRLWDAESDMSDEVKAKVKELRESRSHIAKLVKDKGLVVGLYRVGEHQIEIKATAGGGFSVDQWEGKRVTFGGGH